MVGRLDVAVTLVPDVDIRCRATGTNGALGRIRTSDTRFRKPVLYPLSYEGVSMWNPWSALSPTVPREAHTSPDSRVGRTVTGNNRIGQALEFVIDHVAMSASEFSTDERLRVHRTPVTRAPADSAGSAAKLHSGWATRSRRSQWAERPPDVGC